MTRKKLIQKMVVIALTSTLIVGIIGLWKLKPRLESYFATTLKEMGLQNVQITIAQIGLNTAEISEISIGSDDPLTLHDIALNYSLNNIRQGYLDEILIENVSIKAKQQQNNLLIHGLEGLKGSSPNNKSNESPLSFLALNTNQVKQIPFNQLTVKAGTIELLTSFGTIKSPLNLKWQKYKTPNLSYKGKNISFAHEEIKISIANSQMSAALEDSIWTGDWSAEAIKTNLPFPPISTHGQITANDERINATGSFFSRDNAYKGNFTFNYAPEETTSGLKLNNATMPWKKGRLSIENIWLPFESKEPIKIDIQVEHIDLAELMETLIDNRIKAKGLVSGYISLIIDSNGKIFVQDAKLSADAPGTIIMPPGTIPANNQQINIVKEIMQDLNYDVLNISADPDKNGELSIKLTVEGKNPKVYDGRSVKLNINLTGNLLDFFQQNLMFLTEPETFLKESQNYDKKE